MSRGEVIPERRTARMDGEFVVFLIGMRVNRWWKVGNWFRTALAMPRMLRELGEHPELGYLGGEGWFGRTTIMVQYWRSTEHLLAYARNKTNAHLPAWRKFNETVGNNGDVGVWHETYKSRAGDYENVYANMPAFGLGAVGLSVKAEGHLAHAAKRLAAPAPAPASTETAATEPASEVV
ncbi:MAG: DUF4188 domain-containing protein [Labilithrix sp.]